MQNYLKTLPHSFIGSGNKDNTVTITAGMDGDEYASIEAAYKLIEILKETKINGKVNIFPIVNIAGFKNVSSINPVDNKFPKYIFPGKPNGSDTEKLIYFLYENYIKHSSIWIDLHGGGITEYLEPYIYSYITDSANNNLTMEVVRKLNVQKLVLGKPGWWDATEMLGKLGVSYFILESGY